MTSTDSSLTDFPVWLKSVREPIDAELDRLVPSADVAPQRIHEAMRYSLFAGGKRIRPALTLLAGETLGASRERLLPGAVALEMIHTYSLIHDDLPMLDDDDLRRGRPTAHKAFDEATAILAGDALLTLGLTVLADEPQEATSEQRRRAAAEVGYAIGTLGMIGGQVDDLAAEADWPEDAEGMLEAIHRRKTGALLTASVRLGGFYADAGDEIDGLLTEIGDHIGLMFQIADDILDVSATSEALGKTAGKDAAVRKLTYPGLYGLDESRRRLNSVREQALDGIARLADATSSDRGIDLFRSLVEYMCDREN